ncbi:MAG: tetratricopeptide repeat protein [Verrucomicrobiota bacterium]|nr:tetratricopeptide repeat protein [Verrucomicrobiota bacterium]
MKSLPQEKLTASASRWPVLITAGICISLVALVWIVFGQTLGFDFANVDDSSYVLKNIAVARGLTSHGFVWAFTHFHAGNWHPFTWISHMIDCQRFGLKPRGHHFTNVLLHSATAVALFLSLREITRAVWPSAFLAAIFAIHPLRAESVVWVAERKDVLSGFFFVLTILAYVRYARRPSRGRYLLTLGIFVAGLLSKPMLVTVPVVLLLLDYWPLDRFGKGQSVRLFVEKIPMFICAFAVAIATLFAQRDAIIEIANVPIATRIGNAITSYGIYLRQTFWPTNLAPFYPLGVSIPALLISSFFLIAISLAIFFFRDRKFLVTGWLWYLVMLLPVIGLVQVGEQSHADRYTYLPQIGLLIALTWAITDLTSSSSRARFVLGPVSAIVLLALIIDARRQTGYWQNSETLWRHALAVTPDNPVARRNLGEVQQDMGRLDEAVENYRRALAFDPAQALAHTNLGVILLEKGNPREAIQHFETALKIRPKYVEAESNLGLALSESHRVEDSFVHLQRAIEIDPDFADAHYNLGTSFLSLGHFAEAVTEYKKAIDLNPADERALNNLAWILSTAPQENIRDGKEAVACALRADELTAGKNPRTGATLAAPTRSSVVLTMR